ncbi:MAG: hypothetical protein DRI44_05395 [Chlamydiae bacterium]|nr:MAG: hypothetical protein DRI44_05395 [Chlamydiota bacterium]
MCEREIEKDIVFREIKSWHRLSYAGEGLKFGPGGDRSGCICDDGKCFPPLTVCHRVYYHKKNPKFMISAFLSYPNGMADINEYFWETRGTKKSDVERFFGKNAERKMEKKIIRVLKKEFEKRIR